MKLAWRAGAAIVALCAALLIAGYSAVVPAFEAPDEPGHFGYAEVLARGRGLPVQGQAGRYDPELSQPPLYYTFQAAIARLISPSGARVPDLAHQNVYQNTTPKGNVNLYSHPAAEHVPWTGQILQLHVMRLANLLFAAVTLLGTFGIGLELGLSAAVSLAAAGTLALLPQFDFITGALNADNAITAASAAALYLLLRWLNRPPALSAALPLAVAVAASMLSKLSGLAVLGLVAAAMLWRAGRDRNRQAMGQAILATGLAIVLGGWWYARNLALFGDLLGWQPMLTSIGGMLRPRPLTPLEAAAAFLQAWPTAAGVFGWNNLRLPPAAYAVVAGSAVAALGLLEWLAGAWVLRAAKRAALAGNGRWAALLPLLERRWATNPTERAQVLLLAAWGAVFAASLVRWVQVNADAAQWRLLFPAFPALVVLVTLGLARLLRPLAFVLPASLGVLSVGSLLLVVRPAYTPDPPYSGAIQHAVNVRFGERLELAGYDDPRPRNPLPGQPVTVTLYWRALQPVGLDEVVDLAAVDAEGRQGLKQTTWPQNGRAPTTGWRPGDLVRDEHLLATPESLAPGVWNLELDAFQPLPNAPRLPVAGGGSTYPVGRFLVAPPAISSGTPEATFDGGLTLLQHEQSIEGGKLQVTLIWQAAGPLAQDDTVFVHLLDSSGTLVAQDDSQPAAGRFPTSLLGAGMTVADTHVLDVTGFEPTLYQIELGLYNAHTGQRLRAAGKDALLFPVRL